MHDRFEFLPNGDIQHYYGDDLRATIKPDHIQDYCDALGFEVPEKEAE